MCPIINIRPAFLGVVSSIDSLLEEMVVLISIHIHFVNSKVEKGQLNAVAHTHQTSHYKNLILLSLPISSMQLFCYNVFFSTGCTTSMISETFAMCLNHFVTFTVYLWEAKQLEIRCLHP